MPEHGCLSTSGPWVGMLQLLTDETISLIIGDAMAGGIDEWERQDCSERTRLLAEIEAEFRIH